MGVLQDFCQAGDPGANGILITASGEVLALTGYRFPPAQPGDFALVDGWDVTFDHVITTFDHVILSSDPDKSPTDQSQTGPVVAEADGPFAIDLHRGGPLVGKGGPPEQAAPIAAISNQNKAGNAAFDSSVRYAFGFDIVAATATAKNVNLDAAGIAEYQQMVSDGCTTLVVGTAVWKGNAGGVVPGGCTQSAAPVYDFAALPETVKVHFCFKAPTSYVNAQNPENDPAAPLGNEEHQRGVHTVKNQSTIAQATFHLDHYLWESFVHDSPPHFDQYAAKYAGATTTPTAKLEDYKAYALTPFVDAQGHQVPWRDCLGADYTAPTDGAMTFDTTSIQVNPTATCDATKCDDIRDFYDYATYNHSTYGHLNADGLAFVNRHYPSPP